MARPPIDDTAGVTDIARLMLDGDYFDPRMPHIGFKFCRIAYRDAREKVCDRAGVPPEGRDRRSMHWRLDRKFREITGTKDQNGVDLDLLRLVAIDARLPRMIERHPELGAEINLDHLTKLRRHHPASLTGWLRVQVDIYG